MRKLFFLAFLAFPLYSQTSNFSWTFPVGARVLAMGEAATADAQDPSTIWWNPAGLTQIEGEHLLAMQEKLFNIIPHDSFVFSKKFSDVSLGFFLSQTDYTVPLGFKWKEDSYFLSFAMESGAAKEFSFGANLKFGRLRNVIGSGNLLGLDLGFLYFFNPQFKAGLMFQDIFSKATYSTGTEETFDPHVALGFSFKTDQATTFNLDFRDFHSSEPDMPLEIKLGIERWFDPVVAVRFGYILSDQDDRSRITGGAGLVLGPWEIDYAFDPHPGPQNSESLRLSLTYKLK